MLILKAKLDPDDRSRVNFTCNVVLIFFFYTLTDTHSADQIIFICSIEMRIKLIKVLIILID